MFRKILIANRGEIACRIIATARRLGIGTVAVYSDADRTARHVMLADEAYALGAAPARESYLAIDRILHAAKQAGADAVHPGYGFLSENADFAEACAAAGLVFIGPPVAAIRAMGSKSAAKALMAAAGVPLVPGYYGVAQDEATLLQEARKIGFPILIKASAGGGGKGMRIVAQEADFPAALEGARAEARAAFGDDTVLLETYLQNPRHIEIQIFADQQGQTVSLFERDCSIQRRYQKILEEAPAPGVDPAWRDAMSAAAIAAARAVHYVGAGTVEFICTDQAFYFMEMNTRLQVEHPVTEMITGQDLVAWQIRVAAGQALPCSQAELTINGHAIEARIYAEDPARAFLPSIGPLQHLRQPQASDFVRVDTGVVEGSKITPYYDPMIAKLIVWGETRDVALQRLRAALDAYEVEGVETNLDLLRAIAAHPAYRQARLHTGFIPAYPEVLQSDAAGGTHHMAIAALAWHLAGNAAGTRDPSPWQADGWRMHEAGGLTFAFLCDDAEYRAAVWPKEDGTLIVDIDDASLSVRGEMQADRVALTVDGITKPVRILQDGLALTVIIAGRNHRLRLVDPFAPPAAAGGDDGPLVAPIPGRISRIMVREGERVVKGAELLVMESMKMEIRLSAPRDGIVGPMRVRADDMVEAGAELVSVLAETP